MAYISVPLLNKSQQVSLENLEYKTKICFQNHLYKIYKISYEQEHLLSANLLNFLLLTQNHAQYIHIC